MANEFVEERENDDGYYIYECKALGEERREPFFYDEIYCYVCPRCCITNETFELNSLYSMCKTLGQLPYEGALYDQPSALIEAFMVISSEISNCEEAGREKGRKGKGKPPVDPPPTITTRKG